MAVSADDFHFNLQRMFFEIMKCDNMCYDLLLTLSDFLLFIAMCEEGWFILGTVPGVIYFQ